MTWSPDELVWLGGIAMAGIITLAAGLADMRRPCYGSWPRASRVFHKISLAVTAAGLAGFLATMAIMTWRGAA